MTTAVATLVPDAGAEAEARKQNAELIARAVSVLFAIAAVLFAGIVAVLTQLQ
jgi:hypothetical protein